MTERNLVIGIDQSTQGTKALLFGPDGKLLRRADVPHRQIVNELGWVSHDLNEIYRNTLEAVRRLLEESGTAPCRVAAVGISNQRETTALWDRRTGEPLEDAVVWQCGRAESIVKELSSESCGEKVRLATGIPLSAYFPAAKMAWLLRAGKGRAERAARGELCLGTIDSWLLFRLTENHVFRTDASNASRTQLFNLRTLAWDEDLCALFGVPRTALAEVCDSDSLFGFTRMEGIFEEPVPIHAVLGDSHAALFGQGCLRPGMVKATYGTGSSLMMNIGKDPVVSSHGVVTSLAWKLGGKAEYVLEGNLNYTGAVITWLKDSLGLISSAKETEALALAANPNDTTYLVPAFTGLGAPYWDGNARAAAVGMSRTTGKAEFVRAALDCIAYQITDLIFAMEQDAGIGIGELRVDGGPTRNRCLMQFQSDISGKRVDVPEAEELSGIGAAYLAGVSAGLWKTKELFASRESSAYTPKMDKAESARKYAGWLRAVNSVLTGQHTAS